MTERLLLFLDYGAIGAPLTCEIAVQVYDYIH